jgi:transcriptional regulator with XRE-family HTH domain
MTENGQLPHPGARLKAAIKARFGTLAEFARRVDMKETQLSATLRANRRPNVETLDRFSAVLGWPLNELRRWYGYAVAEEHDEASPLLRFVAAEEATITPDVIVAYVENKPGLAWREQVRAVRERLPYDRYERWCLGIYRAWTSNGQLAIESVELAD